jgi:hypothetical protein
MVVLKLSSCGGAEEVGREQKGGAKLSKEEGTHRWRWRR